MSNQLTLKVWNMDYSFLIRNYLNPEMWQKEWTLFEYKHYKVTMNIWSILTRREEIMLDIRLHYVDKAGYAQYDERTISFSLKIEDVTFLKRQINSAIFDLMVRVERNSEIIRTDYYYELEKMRLSERAELRDIAIEFLDDNNIESENLRDTYIESYVDTFCKVPKMITEYTESRIYQELPDLYLTWLSCLEDDPKKEIRTSEIQKALTQNDFERVMKEVEEYKQYIQTEEYKDELVSNLEEI